MTVQTLKQQVKELLDSADEELQREFFYSEFDEEFSKYDSEKSVAFKTALQSSGISTKHVDNYGGEDQGSDYWSVYEFSKGKDKVLVKFNGYYYSYDGSTFDEWFFTKPVPKSGFDYVQE